MDLTARLLRRTPPRPLIVAAVGGDRIRFAAERLCTERGWLPAAAPAEANLMVVCGTPDADTAHAVDDVWTQIPLPRAQVHLPDPATVPRRLTEALAALRDPSTRYISEPPGHGAHDHHARGDSGHGDGTGAQRPHGHGEHEPGGMEMPGGVAMADRAEDRDGLRLDRLRVPLGPVLPYWPAGLRLRLGLQGDVVQTVEVDVLATGCDRVPPAALVLDRAAALLALAGWEPAAREGWLLRDAALDGHPPPGRLERWCARVRRSRMLRWSLAGLGTVASRGTTIDGDALDRLYRWLDALRDGTAGITATGVRAALDVLPAMLAGTELAAARLIVASLGIALGALDREATR